MALSCVSEKGMKSHAILIWQQHCCVSSCLAFSAALLPSEEMENNLTPNLLKLWEKTTINFVRLFSVVKCGSSYTSSLHHPPPSQSAHWHWGHQGGSMFRHAQESRYTQACSAQTWVQEGVNSGFVPLFEQEQPLSLAMLSFLSSPPGLVGTLNAAAPPVPQITCSTAAPSLPQLLLLWVFVLLPALTTENPIRGCLWYNKFMVWRNIISEIRIESCLGCSHHAVAECRWCSCWVQSPALVFFTPKHDPCFLGPQQRTNLNDITAPPVLTDQHVTSQEH